MPRGLEGQRLHDARLQVGGVRRRRRARHLHGTRHVQLHRGLGRCRLLTRGVPE